MVCGNRCTCGLLLDCDDPGPLCYRCELDRQERQNDRKVAQREVFTYEGNDKPTDGK